MSFGLLHHYNAREEYFKKKSFICLIYKDQQQMQWHKAFLWEKIFFTAVSNHAGGSCQSDMLVQTWERSSNLLSHLHTADPEQCEVSVNVGLSVSEKNNFVKVLDKSNLFQKLQRSCVNVIVTSFLGFLFQTKFGRKIGPGLSLYGILAKQNWFQTKCITLGWRHVKTMSTVMWILGVGPSR